MYKNTVPQLKPRLKKKWSSQHRRRRRTSKSLVPKKMVGPQKKRVNSSEKGFK
jgi:hypothetical protein